jgi:predicted nucleic acid-binding protein
MSLAAMRNVTKAAFARSPRKPLIEQARQLRRAVGAYEAPYISPGERLGIPLLTCDATLAGSNGHHAETTLYRRR